MRVCPMGRFAAYVAVTSAVIVAVVTCACGSKTEERTIGHIRLQKVLDRLKGGADREELRMWLGRCVGERVERVGAEGQSVGLRDSGGLVVLLIARVGDAVGASGL